MSRHADYIDSDLGTVVWNDDRGEWEFTIVVPPRRRVEGSIRPEDDEVHLSAPELSESRECVRWVRDNEATLRQYVAYRMYQLMLNWHDPEWGPPLSKEEFRDKIALVGVQVLEDHRASVLFDDAGCFGGHTITFSVGIDGRLDDEPALWG